MEQLVDLLYIQVVWDSNNVNYREDIIDVYNVMRDDATICIKKSSFCHFWVKVYKSEMLSKKVDPVGFEYGHEISLKLENFCQTHI